MSKARNTTGRGYFTVQGREPLAKRAVAVRLPESVDAELRQEIGEDLNNWLRQAIIEQWVKHKKETV